MFWNFEGNSFTKFWYLISSYSILPAYQACANLCKAWKHYEQDCNLKGQAIQVVFFNSQEFNRITTIKKLQMSHGNICDGLLLSNTLQKPLYFDAYQEHLKAVQLNEDLKSGKKWQHQRRISANFEKHLIVAVWVVFSCCFFGFFLCSFSPLFPLVNNCRHCEKVPNYRVFSCPYFPAFELNTGKNGPENTPYVGTFHAVRGIARTPADI